MARASTSRSLPFLRVTPASATWPTLRTYRTTGAERSRRSSRLTSSSIGRPPPRSAVGTARKPHGERSTPGASRRSDPSEPRSHPGSLGYPDAPCTEQGLAGRRGADDRANQGRLGLKGRDAASSWREVNDWINDQ